MKKLILIIGMVLIGVPAVWAKHLKYGVCGTL